MKLNNKFLIIIAVTVFQLILLSYLTIRGSRKLNDLKQYQYVQSEIRAELNELSMYTTDIDYKGFPVSRASQDWNGKIDQLNQKIEYYCKDEITKSFSSDFIQLLDSTEGAWQKLKNRISLLTPVITQMQTLAVPDFERTMIESNGIRESYRIYSDNEIFGQLYSLLLTVHNNLDGVDRLRTNLADFNNQTEPYLLNELKREQRAYNVSVIIISALSSIVLSAIIFVITSQIYRNIVSIQKVTEILSKKDFSISLKPNGSKEIRSLMLNMNNMIEQINNFFVVVKTTASKAISSGYMITDSANSTAAASSQIAENLDTISKEFEEMTEAIKSSIGVISQMNTQIAILVENNQKQSVAIDNSNKAVNEVVGTLEYMNQMAIKRTQSAEEMNVLIADGDAKINSTKNVLDDINSKLDEVKEVVTIINGVANKTNLLSMNAAIESAHAGEAGKGFGVVASEIRSLAEATQKNSVRIAEVIQNIVNSVYQANESSKQASVAFEKVSSQAEEIISSLQEITSGIGKIDSQMHQIKDRSQETSDAADTINSYCGDISKKQNLVSEEVNSMKDLFIQSTASMKKMKEGTLEIVDKMKEVRTSSKDSYKNMTDLENVLEEFKTKTEVDEAVGQVDQENAIDSPVSEELKNLIDSAESGDLSKFEDLDGGISVSSDDSVEFNLDDIEEYKG